MPARTTNVTSATPIISAAAVAAVRPGLRCALPSASFPAAPPDPPGGETYDPDERAHEPRREHRDPDEQSQHADAEQGEPVADGRCRRRASRSRARRPRARRSTPRLYGVKRANRPRGSVAPSRTAAIGGTCVARIAGKRPATSVTIVPTSSETTIVRVAKTVSVCGSSRFERLEELVQPDRERETAEQADDRGAQADHERFEDHGAQHLTPRRAERAQGGELPRALRDRDRERVEDHERPDEERDPREREQEVADDRRERRRSRSTSSSACSTPVRTVTSLPSSRRIRSRRPARASCPPRPRPAIGVELPFLVQEPLRRRYVEDRERGTTDRAQRRRTSRSRRSRTPVAARAPRRRSCLRARSPRRRPLPRRRRPRRRRWASGPRRG